MKHINYIEVKKLKEQNRLEFIGGNHINVNNQGNYGINSDGSKLYRKRMSSPKVIFDLIANIKIS